MEHAGETSLVKRMASSKNKWPEQQIWTWFTKICLALQQYHSSQVVHGNIRADNIFLTGTDEIKLGHMKVHEHKIDLGTIVSVDLLHKMDKYKAPEAFEAEIEKENACDIWALGVLLYEMCTFQSPFGGSYLTMVDSIKAVQIADFPDHVGDEFRILIPSLL